MIDMARTKKNTSYLLVGAAGVAAYYLFFRKKGGVGKTFVGDLFSEGKDLFQDLEGAAEDLSTSVHHGFHRSSPLHGGMHAARRRPPFHSAPSYVEPSYSSPQYPQYSAPQYGNQQYDDQYGMQQYVTPQPAPMNQGYGAISTHHPVSVPAVKSGRRVPLQQAYYPLPTARPIQEIQPVLAAKKAPPAAKAGKFISKMMGGPPSTPAGGADEGLRSTQWALNQYFGRKILEEDGIMGPETAGALKEFQSAEGLPVTGALDKATHDRLMASLDQKKGLSGLADWWGKFTKAFSKTPSAPAAIEASTSDDSSSASSDSGGDGVDVWGGLRETAANWLLPPPISASRHLLAQQQKTKAAGEFRTGIQSTSMYDPRFYDYPSDVDVY